jgi:hypothetical protein
MVRRSDEPDSTGIDRLPAVPFRLAIGFPGSGATL